MDAKEDKEIVFYVNVSALDREQDKQIEEFRRELWSFPLINDDPSSANACCIQRTRVDVEESKMLSRIIWDSPFYRMSPFQPLNSLCPAQRDEENKRRGRITRTCEEFRDEIKHRANKARDRLSTLWTQLLCPDFNVPVFQVGEKINGLDLDEKFVYPTYEEFCLLNTDWHDMLAETAQKLQPTAEASASSLPELADDKSASNMSAHDLRLCEAIDQTRLEIKRLVDTRVESKRRKSNCRKRYIRKRRMYKRFEQSLLDFVMPHWIRHEAELPHSARTRYQMGHATAQDDAKMSKVLKRDSEHKVAFRAVAKWLFDLPYPHQMMVRVVQWLDYRSESWSSARLVAADELFAKLAVDPKFLGFGPEFLGFDPRAVSQLCEWILRKSRVLTSSYEPRIKLLDEIANFRRDLALIVCGYAYEMAWYKLIGTVKTQAEAREILNTAICDLATSCEGIIEHRGWTYKPHVLTDTTERAPPRLNLSSYSCEMLRS